MVLPRHDSSPVVKFSVSWKRKALHQANLKIYTTWSRKPWLFANIWNATVKIETRNTVWFWSKVESIVWPDITRPRKCCHQPGNMNHRRPLLFSLRRWPECPRASLVFRFSIERKQTEKKRNRIFRYKEIKSGEKKNIEEQLFFHLSDRTWPSSFRWHSSWHWKSSMAANELISILESTATGCKYSLRNQFRSLSLSLSSSKWSTSCQRISRQSGKW